MFPAPTQLRLSRSGNMGFSVLYVHIQYVLERREAACERNSYALDGAAASFRASTASLWLRYFQWNKADWHQRSCCNDGIRMLLSIHVFTAPDDAIPKLHDLTLTGLFCHFYGHLGARKIVGTKKVVFSDSKSEVRTYLWSFRVQSFSASHLEYSYTLTIQLYFAIIIWTTVKII